MIEFEPKHSGDVACNKDLESLSATEINENIPLNHISPSKLYHTYVSSYGTHFRARKDFQYEEKPYQIYFSLLLILSIVLLSFFTSGFPFSQLSKSTNNDLIASKLPTTDHFPTPNIAPATEQLHKNSEYSFERAGHEAKNAVDYDLIYSVRYGLFGLLVTLIFYCFLQTRDSLFIRPHPGVWRVVHAFGLMQLLILIFLFVIPADHGRHILELLFPNISTRKSAENGFAGTIELDCNINASTIIRQLKTPWFTCHVIGWFLKMCMFRDWAFCLVFSITFELAELSFQWLIPEMKECWWDSIILDAMFSNMIGMIFGSYFLTYMRTSRFNWRSGSQSNQEKEHKNPKTKPFLLSLPYILLPFSWSEYHWKFFDSPKRLAHSLFLLIVSVTLELNSFFLIYVLDTKATHGLNIARTINVCIQALLTVAEHYEYADGNLSRIGHNEILLFTIYVMELLVIAKYGYSRFTVFIPPWEILQPWFISSLLFMLWSFLYFFDKHHLKNSFLSHNVSHKTSHNLLVSGLLALSNIVLKFPFIFCFLPLISLTKYYHF